MAAKEDEASNNVNDKQHTFIVGNNVCLVDDNIAHHFKTHPGDLLKIIPEQKGNAKDTSNKNVIVIKAADKSSKDSQSNGDSQSFGEVDNTDDASTLSQVKIQASVPNSGEVQLATVDLGGKHEIRWGALAIQELISVYRDHLSIINTGQVKKKTIWNLLATKLREKGHAVTETQVENKWKNLVIHYRNPTKNQRLHRSCATCQQLQSILPDDSKYNARNEYLEKKVSKKKSKMPPRRPKRQVKRCKSKYEVDEDDEGQSQESEGSESGYNYDSDESFVCDAPNKQWTRKSELMLMNLYRKYKNLMKMGREEKWNAWKIITAELNAAGNKFTEHQAKSKWGSLAYSYNVASALQTDYPYSKQMSEALNAEESSQYLGQTGQYNDSELGNHRNNAGEGSSNEANSSENNKKRKQKNKETEQANSSKKIKNRRRYNDDIIDALREMHDECVEEERKSRELARQIHEEKMQVMNSFIDLLKQIVEDT